MSAQKENGGTLTVYQRMNDPLAAVDMLGKAIAKSGMFGCGSIEQGQVFALECLARGMPPLTLAERYHVVQGKLMMKYDAMLAEFHALGGKHKILSRTEDKAEIQLLIDGEMHTESCTWEQAQKEKWPFKSDGKTVKDNWATPKSRRQMLWARVVSEGVRALRPGVNNGRYVVEEIDDDSPHAGNGHAATAATVMPTASVVDQAEAAAKKTAVEVEFEVKLQSDSNPITAAEPLYSTAEQRTEIESLFDQLFGQGTQLRMDKLTAALAKRKATSLRSVTAADAAVMIANLNGLVEKAKSAADAALPKVEPQAPPTDPKLAGPCTPELDREIKAALEEWKQIDPAKQGEELKWLKAKLAESKRAKIIELSYRDAQVLLAAVRTRNLASFIQASLTPKT